MNHTKEPWYEEYNICDEEGPLDEPVFSGEILASPDDCGITQTICYGVLSEENAQRIVDCVNACAGITSEALQAGYIKHLVEWDEVNHNCLDKVDSKVTPFEFKGVKILEDTK